MRSLVLVLALVSLFPSLASAQFVPTGRPVRVRFVGSDPALTFHVPVGSLGGAAWSRYGVVGWSQQSYRPVCTAPCERWLPEDTYRFALSRDGGGEIMAPGAITLTDGATIYGHYIDNSTTRDIGAAVTVISALACPALAIVGAAIGNRWDGLDWEAALPWFVGSGAALVTMWIGIGMMWVFDHTEVRVLAPGESI